MTATKISINTDTFSKSMNEIVKQQIPFAAAKALTLTAKDSQKVLRLKMPRVFDRPTPYILKSTRIKPARKNNLVATVTFKNESLKSQPPSEYMMVHTKGGQRPDKRSEKLLRARGLLPEGYHVVPGQGVRLNKYGNVTRGQIQKVLSNIGAQFDRYQNSSDASKKQYFVGSPGGAPLGVWQRLPKNRVRPIFIFVQGEPQYRSRFPFKQTVEKVVAARLQVHLRRSLSEAIKTAR